MRRIEEQDVTGVLPQPVWQETMHRLMITEAIMLGYIRGPNPARQLAEKPDLVKKLTMYRDKVKALVTLGLGLLHFLRCRSRIVLLPDESKSRNDERLLEWLQAMAPPTRLPARTAMAQSI